jgi:hypothetical protein
MMARRTALVLQLLLACLLLQASHAQFTTILSDDAAPAEQQQASSMAAAIASGSNAAAQAIAAAQANGAAAMAAATAEGNGAAAQAAAVAMTTTQDNNNILGASSGPTPTMAAGQADPAAASSEPEVQAAAAPLMPMQPMFRGVPMMQGGFTSILPDGECRVQRDAATRAGCLCLLPPAWGAGRKALSQHCGCHSRLHMDPCQGLARPLAHFAEHLQVSLRL